MEPQQDVPEPRSHRLLLVLLVLGVAASIFAGLGLYGLQEPDEGRYSDIAAIMLRTGEWLTPRQNDIRYYAKPPLYFWTAAASMGVFGVNELGARMPSALSSFLVVLLTYAWGRRAFGQRAGLVSALVLATLPLFGALARTALVDLVLTLLTTAGLYAAYRAFIAQPRASGVHRGWTWAFWALAGLGILNKGPLALCLSLSGVVVYLVLRRDWRVLWSFHRPDGPLLMLVIAAPWYLLMQYRFPEYFNDFFIENNVERFTTGGPFGRQAPFWFYLPIVVGTLLPWSLAFPAVLARAWRQRAEPDTEAGQTRAFALIALLVPLGILSLAQSKHAYYLLPLLPMAALALGPDLAQWMRETERAGNRFATGLATVARHLVGGVFAALAIAVAFFHGQLAELLVNRFDAAAAAETLTLARAPLIAVSGIFAAGLFGSSWLLRQGRRERAAGVYGGGFLLMVALLPWVLVGAEDMQETRSMSAAIERTARPGEPLAMFDHYYRGVPFYLERPMILWKAKRKEFSHTLDDVEAEGRALGGDPERLRELQAQHESVLWLVPGPRELAALRTHAQVPVSIVYQTSTFLLARSGLGESGTDEPVAGDPAAATLLPE